MPTLKHTALASRGTVLTTELDALANGGWSNPGPEYDQATNLDRHGIAELLVDFVLAPTDFYPVNLYAVQTLDGTNYEDGSGTVRPAAKCFLGCFQLKATTNAQRIQTQPFDLPPGKLKFLVENLSGQNFPATGSTVSLFTFNDQGV